MSDADEQQRRRWIGRLTVRHWLLTALGAGIPLGLITAAVSPALFFVPMVAIGVIGLGVTATARVVAEGRTIVAERAALDAAWRSAQALEAEARAAGEGQLAMADEEADGGLSPPRSE